MGRFSANSHERDDTPDHARNINFAFAFPQREQAIASTFAH
jgi:hypothetical protein